MKIEELKNKVGRKMKLTELEGIEEYSLDYIFNDQVYNLPIGTHNKVMEGSYSMEHEKEIINIVFETVGDWKVVDNSQHSNVYKTAIDEDSITIKIKDIELI